MTKKYIKKDWLSLFPLTKYVILGVKSVFFLHVYDVLKGGSTFCTEIFITSIQNQKVELSTTNTPTLCLNFYQILPNQLTSQCNFITTFVGFRA